MTTLHLLKVPFDEAAKTFVDSRLEEAVERVGVATVDINLGKDIKLNSIISCKSLDFLCSSRLLMERGGEEGGGREGTREVT